MEPSGLVSRERVASRALPSDLRSLARDPDADLEAKALLGALRGTRLSAGPTWDDECDVRLRAFQASVHLRATGRPDEATLGALAQAVEAQRATALPSREEVSHARKTLEAVFHGVASNVQIVAHDARFRAEYVQEVREMAELVLRLYESGQLSLSEATYLAVHQRNALMNETRELMSTTSNALAKMLKEEGISMDQALARSAHHLYGKPTAKLTPAELGKVQLRVVERAGVTNPRVNAGMAQMPRVSTVLHAFAIAYAFVQVANADDPVEEALAQAAGFAGGWAGAKVGAFAGGLVCGPPCALVGALAGGLAGSYVADEAARASYRSLRG